MPQLQILKRNYLNKMIISQCFVQYCYNVNYTSMSTSMSACMQSHSMLVELCTRTDNPRLNQLQSMLLHTLDTSNTLHNLISQYTWYIQVSIALIFIFELVHVIIIRHTFHHFTYNMFSKRFPIQLCLLIFLKRNLLQ